MDKRLLNKNSVYKITGSQIGIMLVMLYSAGHHEY